MVKLRPREYIFSLTNSGTNKVITILGFKIKLDRTAYYKKFCAELPVEENKIVFCNFNGGSYGCNPKYIAQEIIRRKLPYNLVWLVNSVEKEVAKNYFPPEIKLVGYGTKGALCELASAKLWIDNQRKNYFIKKGLTKKEGQYFIQTWHGSLGIKKLDADVKAFTGETKQSWVERSQYDSSLWNYLLTNSDFEDNIFRRALWFNNEIKKFGHPRNDIFFENSEKIKAKVREFYHIPNNKNILLYVPSFRDNGSVDCYDLDYDKVLDACEVRFGGEWVCITRFHPRVKISDKDFSTRNPRIINGTNYPDIQELLVTSDIAITDYSSCIFDFMLSKNPAFIFATDIEKFNNDRGFYYSLEETPFPIASNNDTLVKNILNFDGEKYKIDVELFLRGKGCIEDGHASKRTVDLIESIMNNGLNNESEVVAKNCCLINE